VNFVSLPVALLVPGVFRVWSIQRAKARPRWGLHGGWAVSVQEELLLAPRQVAVAEQAAVESVSELAEVAAEPVSELAEVAAEPVSELAEAAAEPVSELAEAAVEPVSELAEVAAEPVSELVEAAVEPVSELVEAAVEPVSELEQAEQALTGGPQVLLADVWLVEQSPAAEKVFELIVAEVQVGLLAFP
jgi:hypothetical protein